MGEEKHYRFVWLFGFFFFVCRWALFGWFFNMLQCTKIEKISRLCLSHCSSPTFRNDQEKSLQALNNSTFLVNWRWQRLQGSTDTASGKHSLGSLKGCVTSLGLAQPHNPPPPHRGTCIVALSSVFRLHCATAGNAWQMRSWDRGGFVFLTTVVSISIEV